jgi:hypothetical protein
MRTWAAVLLAAVAVSALVLFWGYWYSRNHASLQLRVDDYALKSERQAYGVPHGVTLTLRDRAKGQLAVARSVEPLGYILAVHPSADIGSCQLREVPVTVRMSNDEWWLWWVPLPHVGGLPRQYFELAVAIDSRACTAVVDPSKP